MSELEERVKRAVLELIERGVTFGAVEVSSALGERQIADVAGVARIMRRLEDAGHFRRFGYKRTLVQDRTQKGVMTSVAFAPMARRPVEPLGRDAERIRTSIKARADEVRPFAYLGLGLKDGRRLERQTKAIRAQALSSGQELVRLGELLLSVHALVGAKKAGRYVEEALSMSRDTARRMMRVARAFKGHPRLETIAAVRPAVLYKLTEPSFPSALREEILRAGGITADEARIPLESVRVRDLVLLKRAWNARIDRQKELHRALERAEAEEERAKVRSQIRKLTERPATLLVSPDLGQKQADALQGITKGAKRLLQSIDVAKGPLPEPLLKEGAEALRRLLAELEKIDPEG